jgi:alginate O-acetyltransferase complex protein AlgI
VAGECCGVRADLRFSRGRLGVLPRRQHPLGDIRATNIVFGRGEMANALFIAVYAAIAWFAPNTQEIMGYDHKSRVVGENLNGWLRRPGFLYAAAAMLAFGVLGISQHSEFIYFRF